VNLAVSNTAVATADIAVENDVIDSNNNNYYNYNYNTNAGVTLSVPRANENSQLTTIPIWKLAAAGAIATLIGDVSMHPLDSIKTLQQSDEGLGLSFMASANVMYTQLGGLSAFYKGFLTYGLCDGIGGALKFATYEGLKRQTEKRLNQDQTQNQHRQRRQQQDQLLQKQERQRSVDNKKNDSDVQLQLLFFVFAGMSFVASSVITVPGELLKQHLQMGHYVGFWDALTSTLRSDGIAGLYTGYDGVFVRDVPYTAMELGLYDLFKATYVTHRWKQYQEQQQQEQQQQQTSGLESDSSTFEDRARTGKDITSTLSSQTTALTIEMPLKASEQLFLAGLTGGVAGFLTTPLDTVKTKLMVDATFAGMSFCDATVMTVHDHGVEALFCGALARVAWLVPNTAIYLPTYDFIKNKLQHMGDESMTQDLRT
jgi:hypothetical protein